MKYESWAWALRTKDGKWRDGDYSTTKLTMDHLYPTRKMASDDRQWIHRGDETCIVKVRVTLEVADE